MIKGELFIAPFGVVIFLVDACPRHYCHTRRLPLPPCVGLLWRRNAPHLSFIYPLSEMIRQTRGGSGGRMKSRFFCFFFLLHNVRESDNRYAWPRELGGRCFIYKPDVWVALHFSNPPVKFR